MTDQAALHQRVLDQSQHLTANNSAIRPPVLGISVLLGIQAKGLHRRNGCQPSQ